MNQNIYKTVFQSYPLKINKINVADEDCTNENLFVSVPIVYKADELFKELNADKLRFDGITVEIMPRYNKVGPTDLLNTDNEAYLTGMFPVRYNFQKSCYVGDGVIKRMASFEVGGKNGISESTAMVKFRLPSAECFLVNTDGTTQTYEEGKFIDASNITNSGKTLVFGQLAVGVDKSSLMVTKSAQNVQVGSDSSSSRYLDYCREVSKTEGKQVKKGKKNVPDYNTSETVFIEEPINGKLYLDYYWIANIQYDIAYTRSAKAISN